MGEPSGDGTASPAPPTGGTPSAGSSLRARGAGRRPVPARNRSGDRDLVDRRRIARVDLWLARYPVTAGGLPQDGAPTIAALEALRDAGGQYLLVPEGGDVAPAA